MDHAGSRKRKFKKRVLSLLTSGMMLFSLAGSLPGVSSVIGASAEDEVEPEFGASFYVMGNEQWNWQAAYCGYDDGKITVSGNAAELAAASREYEDEDSAIGAAGILLHQDHRQRRQTGLRRCTRPRSCLGLCRRRRLGGRSFRRLPYPPEQGIYDRRSR